MDVLNLRNLDSFFNNLFNTKFNKNKLVKENFDNLDRSAIYSNWGVVC